ncbi:MAG: hypothetical protein JOZ62_19070, partial [Acidobacteriaceae bacterium]|nr:hypothetical protein [Acidobacteriaceae bacterium]
GYRDPARPAQENASERGSIDADLLTLGLAKFVKDDVVPNARLAGQALTIANDDVLKYLAPAARGEQAENAALIVRANAAELARSTDRAKAALRVAEKFFDLHRTRTTSTSWMAWSAGSRRPRPT